MDGEGDADKCGFFRSLSGQGTGRWCGLKVNDDGGTNSGHVRVYVDSSCS